MVGPLAGLNPCLHRAMPHATRREMLAAGLGGFFGSKSKAQPAASARPPSSRALQRVMAYAKAHQTTQLLIAQGSRTLMHVGTDPSPTRIFSGTKGFWGFSALAAQEDGLINLDQRAADFLPTWQDDSRRAGITLRHLLDMTSGLEPCFSLHTERHANRNAVALSASQDAPPGRAFIYGPAGLQIFLEILQLQLRRSASRRTAAGYLEQRVLKPLRLGPQRYLADDRGFPMAATGFVMTAAQWARLGHCLMQEGAPILRPASFAQITQGRSPNPAFSLGFWNNRSAGGFWMRGREVDVEQELNKDWKQQNWRRACLCQNAPTDLLAGIGSRHQRLYVIASRQLLVVRLSKKDGDFDDAEFLRLLLD